jgi:hypothetical protein
VHAAKDFVVRFSAMQVMGRFSFTLLLVASLCGCGGRADVLATQLGSDTNRALPERSVAPDQDAVPSRPRELTPSSPALEPPRNDDVLPSEPPRIDEDDASSNLDDDPAVTQPLCELRQIEALLQEKCGDCHKARNFRAGIDCCFEEEPVRMSGLIERGIVIPGNAEMSLLVRRVVLGEMPPANEGYPPLPRADVRRLEAFINSLSPDAGVSCPDSEAAEE